MLKRNIFRKIRKLPKERPNIIKMKSPYGEGLDICLDAIVVGIHLLLQRKRNLRWALLLRQHIVGTASYHAFQSVNDENN